MSREVKLRVVEASVSIVGMVFIWRLVEMAMSMGVDGVYFFLGVAGIAGLGGYELRSVIEAMLRRRGANDKKE